MSLFKKISLSSVAGLFLLAVLAVPIVSAQDSSGNGLQISPTRSEITGNPGETKTFTVNVKNVTSADLYAKAYINDFESDGASGTPKIITDGHKTPYSVADMLKGLSDFTLKPGESKDVNLSLVIPSTTAPGAYFGAVRFAAVPKTDDPGKDQQQVSLTASVGHLVFLTVPGTVVEQIQLSSLKITTDAGSRSFYEKPTKSALTIKNLGNGFARPVGNVAIFNSSNKQIFQYDVNNSDPKAIVLPNSTRVFENKLENISKPGKYKAVASVAYGNGGEVVNYETSFWYLPLWFLGVVLAVLIVLIGGGFFVYKKYIAKRFGK